MKTRLKPLWLLICLLLSGCGGGSPYGKYHSEFIGLFDTVTVIVGYARSEAEFNRYVEIVYDRMEELHRLFDTYQGYDGINNLYTINQNAGISPVTVESEIIDMLLFAKEGYARTNGAVNVAMGAVLKIWHDYRENGLSNPDTAALPPIDKLREAADLTYIDDLIIDSANNTVWLKTPGMSLDVGAVAKGYAIGLAARAAIEAGAYALLLNVGGNVTAIGRPMDDVRVRWGVGIQNPDMYVDDQQDTIDTVYFTDATVSCSGDYQRFYVVDGQRYSHIIDPANLMPADAYRQVVVIHTDPGMADLLSTALFILPQAEGAAIAAAAHAEVLWIYSDNSREATPGYAAISKHMGNYSAVD